MKSTEKHESSSDEDCNWVTSYPFPSDTEQITLK